MDIDMSYTIKNTYRKTIYNFFFNIHEARFFKKKDSVYKLLIDIT